MLEPPQHPMPLRQDWTAFGNGKEHTWILFNLKCKYFDLRLIFLILSPILFKILVKICLGNLHEKCVLGLCFTKRLHCLVILILVSKFFLIANVINYLGNKSW